MSQEQTAGKHSIWKRDLSPIGGGFLGGMGCAILLAIVTVIVLTILRVQFNSYKLGQAFAALGFVLGIVSAFVGLVRVVRGSRPGEVTPQPCTEGKDKEIVGQQALHECKDRLCLLEEELSALRPLMARRKKVGIAGCVGGIVLPAVPAMLLYPDAPTVAVAAAMLGFGAAFVVTRVIFLCMPTYRRLVRRLEEIQEQQQNLRDRMRDLG